jgi:MFS family permease
MRSLLETKRSKTTTGNSSGKKSGLGLIVTQVFGGASRALKVPVFRTYWIGHTLASIGRWMYRTAVGWLAWELTHSPGWLGVIAFADLIPTVLLSILSGAFADRFGFMRIIRISQIMSITLTLALAGLIFSGHIGVFSLLVVTMCLGSAESLGQPARMSAVNAMVSKRDLSSAIALGSASFNASRIIGPAIAGGLILWVGTGFVILACSLMFLLFFLQLRTIKIAERPAGTKASGNLLGDVASGVSYVFWHKGIRFVMALLAATSFFVRPVIELMPGISGQIFNAGPTGLALLLASIGTGALSASLLLARRGQTAGLTRLLVLSTIATGVMLMLAMQFQNIWIASGFLVVMGAFMLSGNVAAQTLVQNSVEPEFRARVMSLFIVFAYGLPALGAVLMGWVAAMSGLQAAIGGGALFMVIFWLWALPKREAMSKRLEGERV